MGSSATPQRYFASSGPGRNRRNRAESACGAGSAAAGATGLEPATSGVTGRRSNQLSYAPGRASQYGKRFFCPCGATFAASRGYSERINLPEDTPNPAVGVFGISDGDLEAGPRRV